MKNGVLKKLLIVLGSVLGILILAAVILPLVIDVDKYRPQISQAVNDRINGKFEIGALKLSLWGQIRIDVAGITLKDAQGRDVLAVKDAYFHLPFLPILSGSPVVTLKTHQPSVNVVKDKAGKLNIMSLMKDSGQPAVAPGQPAAAPQPKAASGGGDVSVPGIVARARLGLELRDALVVYRDDVTGLDNHLRNFNLVVKDLSLSRPTEIEIWGDVDTRMGKSIAIHGPVRIQATAQPTLSNGKLERLAAKLNVNADDLEILMPGLFEKHKGMAAGIEGAFSTSLQEAKIEKLEAKFFNAVVDVSGTVSNLQAPAGAAAATPVMNVTIKSNDIDLKPWVQLVPMLKEYELTGSARLDASAQGPSDKLGYKGSLVVKDLTAKSPVLKSQPVINLSVSIVTDRIEKMLMTMKAPGNDARFEGQLTSFTRPQLTASFSSTGMDLDQLLNLPPLGAETKGQATAGKGGAAGGAAPAPGQSPAAGAPPAADYDKSLDALRGNEIARATRGNIGINLAFIKIYDVKMSEINGKVGLSDLVLSMEPVAMKLWGGAIRASSNIDLKPEHPAYRFSTDVSDLQIEQAVASRFHLFKNTLLGKANARMEGSGTSFNTEPAKRNLNAKGTLKVTDATFATIDVGKMVADGISKAVNQLGDKIPVLKGKGIKSVPHTESKYDSITSDFSIAGGQFNSPNFAAKAAPNRGIDLNGRTTLGLIDYALDAHWEVVDTYNLTHARDLTVDQGGIRAEHVLAKGNDPVRFPVTVQGTAFEPKFNYTEVPEYLGKVVVANLTHGATDKAKAQVQKQVESQIQKAAPPAVQDKLKGLTKKFFGH